MSTQFVRIGRIVGAHGLKGQMKIELLSDSLERLAVGARVRLNDEWAEIETSVIHKGRPLIKLVGVNGVEAAQALQWAYLEAPEEERAELEEDCFYADALIGLRVETTAGEVLGKVDDVLNLPAQDVLQVGETLIPLVREFVKKIDVDAGVIQVQLIPGMLE